ncbi:MAG TPA: hypothetical protein DCR92_00905 [Faecalibacterium sp.]|nr:hypothetical protein [Faecalibacterium sp.]
MKAKRIVSILLTGSMLLSLLPVSALAAAPVFDAPAQTTAKKAVPLVQEADASRSTEEEAATRSSRDLDAENGTAESITTIQLNAAGKPASEGNFGNWYYSAASGCQLDTGVFALQPSSEPEAESALKARLFHIGDKAELVRGTVGCETNNYGTISGGTFQGDVFNTGTISGGTFQGGVNNFGTISNGTFQREVDNCGTISNGTFQQPVYNYRTISGGTFEEVVKMNESTEGAKIEGGTFKKGIELNAYYPIITDGLFDGKVSAAEGYSGTLSISGGYFVNKPTLREGSDIAFTSVSDQAGRTFQVPVNDDWSENGYNELYVPSGSSEQPNTITVKTDTALLDCRAAGVSIMGTDKVRKNDDGSYAIDVYSPAPIVLVTEEPAPPTPGEPGGELDPGLSSGAAALSIVLGTAGLGYITYVCGSSLYLHYVLPDGFIPSTRQELANVLWTAAGKPDPVSTALYTDIPADAIEQQKAARWCAEQGLLSDHGETFGPDMKVYNARIIRAWNSLKKLPVPIK